MIILDATTKSLEVDLDGAIATNQLPIVASFVDVTTTTYAPGATDTETNNTTAVTAVAAPAASTQRQVKLLTIYNRDTAVAIVTVQLNNNATLRTLIKVTLAVGDTLVYTDGEGWRVVTASGQIKSGFGQHDHSLSTEANALVPLSLDVTGGPVKLSGDLSPSQITANQNNYNPTGLATASILRLTSDASRNVTGLAGGADGRLLIIYNVGSNDIVLIDESSSSDADKRFALPSDSLTLQIDHGILLQYDSTVSRWRTAETPALTGVINPSQLVANTNDWNPTGLAGATHIQLSTDASRDLTGIVGGYSGRILILYNIGTNPIVLKNESGSSSATNRFNMVADVIVLQNEMAIFRYGTTFNRWRYVGGSASGSQAWTPILYQNNASVTATVDLARYLQVGKRIDYVVRLSTTGTGTINTMIEVSVPVTALPAWSGAFAFVGYGLLFDSDTGLVYPFLVQLDSGSGRFSFRPTTTTTDARLGLTGAPFTAALASGDIIQISGSYEAA